MFGLAILIFTGCASPETDYGPTFVVQKPIRPTRVLVHDFAAAPGDLPIDAPIGARLASGALISSDQIATDRKLGADMAAQLIVAIRQLGFSTEHASTTAIPAVTDVVVRGCFVSKHDTNAAKPFTIGFDFDASELLTMVEPFQVTPQGVRHGLVTSNNPTGIIVTSGMKIGDKTSARARLDGWAAQTVKEIAESLKIVFQEQGWGN